MSLETGIKLASQHKASFPSSVFMELLTVNKGHKTCSLHCTSFTLVENKEWTFFTLTWYRTSFTGTRSVPSLKSLVLCLILYCHHFGTLNHLWTSGPAFPFCTGPSTLFCRTCLYNIYSSWLCWPALTFIRKPSICPLSLQI